MCGIFGYVGSKQAAPILVSGLQKLEYRGYDSAGMYIAGAGSVKAVGKVAALVAELETKQSAGTAGIAHTRWATHGEPSVSNSHPHSDTAEKIWLVHNGIIENYQALKNELLEAGVEFVSQTDTEVLAQLVASLYKGDLKSALQEALARVHGTYGIAVMATDNPGQIVVARMGSPIVVGVGDDTEMFVASDPSALLEYTNQFIYLEDSEMAVIEADTYTVTSIAGEARAKSPELVLHDVSAVQKNGYDHFMLKEINEAAEVIRNSTRGRIDARAGTVKLGGLEDVAETLATIKRLTIVGCGSAYYAGQMGRLMIEEYAGLPVEIELGSEFRYRRNLGDASSAVLAVTQSGETADTLASIVAAKNLGQLTLGIVNSVGSTIARTTDAGVYNHAGPEIAVASTKAFISQLTVFVLLTVWLGRQREMGGEEASEILTALAGLPDVIEMMLADTAAIEAVARKYANSRDMMFIGRQLHAPIAYEGSLKLKEVSYLHAEAYAGGELKHGSIAMLGPDFPVFAIAPEDAVYAKMVSNIEEVRARKAPVILLTTEGALGADGLADDVLYMPKVHSILQPIIATIPLQLFAYYVGVARGLDVDQPRNLAKSVTVE
ncbi:glutamine--fructose-6-phosphate transaminase (isomerizing) [Patescibacteria group bacterium]|nr:glutamine--fructose-6-phosphate transaminase (isomerizing) [Patescibacteria group bacterium]